MNVVDDAINALTRVINEGPKFAPDDREQIAETIGLLVEYREN